MSQTVAPPIPALVPETAPFSPEQRAWLNGFFAGLVAQTCRLLSLHWHDAVQNHLPAHFIVIRQDAGGFQRRPDQDDDQHKAEKDFEEETLHAPGDLQLAWIGG